MAYNTTLAKLLQRLKKDAGAERIAQNYRGTGSQSYRRQLWVRFKSGAIIDLWLNRHSLVFGGVVKRGGWTTLPAGISYSGKSPEEVYVEAARLLRDWANPSAMYASRARGKKRPKKSQPAAPRNLVARGMILAGTGRGGPMRHRGARRAKEREERWRREED